MILEIQTGQLLLGTKIEEKEEEVSIPLLIVCSFKTLSEIIENYR